MKVLYPSRVRCAYHCKPLKVRTAYPTWYGFHRRGCKPICMNVGQVRFIFELGSLHIPVINLDEDQIADELSDGIYIHQRLAEAVLRDVGEL